MFVDLFTLHRRAKQGLCLSISTPTADHYHCEREKLQRALLSVASSLLHATNEKTVYLPSHSHANYQTRPVPHADQVVPCMCCTVYSQLTCPLSNPDNLFGIGLLAINIIVASDPWMDSLLAITLTASPIITSYSTSSCSRPFALQRKIPDCRAQEHSPVRSQLQSLYAASGEQEIYDEPEDIRSVPSSPRLPTHRITTHLVATHPAFNSRKPDTYTVALPHSVPT